MANQPETVEALRARVDALEQVCGEAYQFAGAVGAPVRVLDALAAAANGDPIPDESMLPVDASECDAVAELRTALDRVRQAIEAA